MTRTDHQVLFTALGFLAVILSDVPHDKQAQRATAIAGLIEFFLHGRRAGSVRR